MVTNYQSLIKAEYLFALVCRWSSHRLLYLQISVLQSRSVFLAPWNCTGKVGIATSLYCAACTVIYRTERLILLTLSNS